MQKFPCSCSETLHFGVISLHVVEVVGVKPTEKLKPETRLSAELSEHPVLSVIRIPGIGVGVLSRSSKRKSRDVMFDVGYKQRRPTSLRAALARCCCACRPDKTHCSRVPGICGSCSYCSASNLYVLRAGLCHGASAADNLGFLRAGASYGSLA